jgi:hypothetical protein
MDETTSPDPVEDATSPDNATAGPADGSMPGPGWQRRSGPALDASGIEQPRLLGERRSVTALEASRTAQPRLVVYQYCISVVILSFRRTSGVKVIAPGQNAVLPGLPYTLISLIFGWWGIPWGPWWTIRTIVVNLHGGIDLTESIRSTVD